MGSSLTTGGQKAQRKVATTSGRSKCAFTKSSSIPIETTVWGDPSGGPHWKAFVAEIEGVVARLSPEQQRDAIILADYFGHAGALEDDDASPRVRFRRHQRRPEPGEAATHDGEVRGLVAGERRRRLRAIRTIQPEAARAGVDECSQMGLDGGSLTG